MARRRQSVTIKHVAADAGVSLQTVSRVINNEPNVRPAMKERVQASIDRLGYVPSIAAQRMSGSRSYIIMAINDRDLTIADWRAREGRDWVDQMLLGGMLTCAKHGYRMLIELVDTHNDHVERELGAAIAALQPDGVILTPPHSENSLITRLLAKRGIPFARIGSMQDGPGIAMSMGDEHNSALATKHLIELGHERIGLIAGPTDFSLSQWRIEGWRQALGEAGLPHENYLERGDFGFESGIAAAGKLLDLDEAPTAIIASSDQMALATLEVAGKRGLSVPRDLSLVSFDNSPIVRFTRPPLTAVDQPIAATISRAVELLIEPPEDNPGHEPVIVEGELVVRGSTATAPRRDG
ncbi:LacI family DNA-binding transcriptional regulator [Altererythrobacter aurantiacus]|uniref:LacI family DNA-binding transcriptional regulator n=1 Tax=Parapontixanthobacter aurantiacus TaxID=1463599 RepID=A0A844ZDG9_9SPHN|nr:LacI family DNA-binding transcriptional regulator [Parapontixanthobacter aurantiacus]MXO85067.1 LacI family DNA-binding transcriptional regulator [Parapontixanthobacter aurantiacus]